MHSHFLHIRIGARYTRTSLLINLFLLKPISKVLGATEAGALALKEWERDVNEQNQNQKKNKDLNKNPSNGNSNSVALSGASGVTLSSNMEEVLRGGKSMAVLILGEDNVAIFDPRLSGVKEFDWKQAQADNITATFPALITTQMVVVNAAKTISDQDSNATKATLERYSWYRYNSTSGKAVDTRTGDEKGTSEEGKEQGKGKGKGKATVALANRSITAAYRQGNSSHRKHDFEKMKVKFMRSVVDNVDWFNRTKRKLENSRPDGLVRDWARRYVKPSLVYTFYTLYTPALPYLHLCTPIIHVSYMYIHHVHT